MKKIIFTICIISAFVLSSCEDFLTKELKGEFSTDTYYQNENQALQAINGVYNAIAFTSFNNALWVFGDVASDDAVKGGNPGDQAGITYIDEFNVDANNGIVSNFWAFTYEAIARANNVIANVPSVPMDEAEKNRIIGEAKFIRAYSYFNLVNIFGRVPLKLLPQLTPQTIHVPLSDVATIYQQIETDLKDAAAVLPDTYSSLNTGRVTKGAALAMLGKVSLYQQKWQAALDYFGEMETTATYSLVPDYADLFTLANENSSESIFEIQHLSNQNPFTGSVLNQWFAPAAEGGYYFNSPTQSLVDAFEKTATGEADPRLDATVDRSSQPYLTKKHQQPLDEIPASLKGDADLNYIYLRYADVLLMKAEAFNELGQPGQALFNLNKVRERARNSFSGTIPAGLLEDINTTDQNSLRLAIRHERRVELAQEFHRYFDLMRWGKAVAEAALGPGFDYDTKRYMPIPQEETDSNQAIK